jgi:hypothetical protein
MNITQRAVKAAKPPATGNHIHYDDQFRGFGLRGHSGERQEFCAELLRRRARAQVHTRALARMERGCGARRGAPMARQNRQGPRPTARARGRAW